MTNIKEKIKGLLKPKKDVIVLDAKNYNALIKQIEFLKECEKSRS